MPSPAVLMWAVACALLAGAVLPASAASAAAEAYRQVPKAVYVWNPGAGMKKRWWAWDENDNAERLVSFCKVHGFNKAMVFVGSVEWDWAAFRNGFLPNEASMLYLTSRLRAQGVEPIAVFYLNDAVNNLDNWERAADVVEAVHRFNERNPAAAFSGLETDQEPTTVSAAYMRMNHGMMQRKAQLGSSLSIGATLKPKWLRDPSPGGRHASVTVDILEGLDTGMVMAYSDREASSVSLGNLALEHAQNAGRRVSIAIETVDVAGASFFSLTTAANKDPFFEMVARMHRGYAAREAYSYLVIHDYDHYFESLYGASPTQFGRADVAGLFQGDNGGVPPTTPTAPTPPQPVRPVVPVPVPVPPTMPVPQGVCGRALCRMAVGRSSHCKTWMASPVCHGSTLPCACGGGGRGGGGAPAPVVPAPPTGLCGTDFCKSLSPGSHCKTWKTPSVCSATNMPCRAC